MKNSGFFYLEIRCSDPLDNDYVHYSYSWDGFMYG